jgi:hypothetical protein
VLLILMFLSVSMSLTRRSERPQAADGSLTTVVAA